MRFAKYLASGAMAAIIEYLSFYLLVSRLGTNIALASGASFVFGLATGFVLHRAWAFKHRQYSKRGHHQLALYTILALVNLGLTIGIVTALHGVGTNPYLAKLIAMGATSLWNFVLMRRFVFSHLA